jgi:hypothetical protein
VLEFTELRLAVEFQTVNYYRNAYLEHLRIFGGAGDDVLL